MSSPPAAGAHRAPGDDGRAVPWSTTRRGVAAVLYLGWILGGGAYLVVCAFTHRGLERWVADWEMAHLGGYWWRATFLAGLVVLVLPALVLVKLLPGDRAGTPGESVPRSPSGPPFDARARAVQVRRVFLWIGATLAMVALVLGFLGQRTAAEPVVYAPFDLSRPTGTPPRHVDLSGVVQTAFVLTQGERIGGHTTLHTYVPVTSSGWGPGDPVVYFLEPTSSVYVGEQGPVRFDRRTPPFAVRVRGTLTRDGLPGTVVSAFEKSGLRVGSTTLLLDPRPAADAEIYFLLAIPAALLALLSVAVLLLARIAGRRESTAAAPRP